MQFKIEKDVSKNGSPTLFCIDSQNKKIYLHSKINPQNEGLRFRKELEDDDSDLLIIFGLGLGYHLDLSLDLMTHKNVIVIDPPELKPRTYKVSEKYNLSLEHFYSLNLSVKEAEAEFSSLLKSLSFKKISVLKHPSISRAFNRFYAEIEKIIQICIDGYVVNEATLNIFSDLFFKNGLKRITCLDEYTFSDSLRGRFHNYSALLVSSAPTSIFLVEQLQSIQHNCYIIAVDSAVPLLWDCGVVADFIISVDPQPYIYEHVLDYNLKDSVLVEAVTAYCTNKTVKKRILGLNSHPLSQLIIEVNGLQGQVLDSKSGNVGGDALQFALQLGFKKIYVAGMDFSFPFYTIYSRGTAYQNRYSNIYNDRFKTTETFNSNYILHNAGRYMIDGRYTRKNFEHYRTSFYQQIKNNRVGLVQIINDKTGSLQVVKDLKLSAAFDKGSYLAKQLSGAKVIGKDLITNLLKKSSVISQLSEASSLSVKFSKKLLTIINNM